MLRPPEKKKAMRAKGPVWTPFDDVIDTLRTGEEPGPLQGEPVRKAAMGFVMARVQGQLRLLVVHRVGQIARGVSGVPLHIHDHQCSAFWFDGELKRESGIRPFRVVEQVDL